MYLKEHPEQKELMYVDSWSLEDDIYEATKMCPTSMAINSLDEMYPDKSRITSKLLYLLDTKLHLAYDNPLEYEKVCVLNKVLPRIVNIVRTPVPNGTNLLKVVSSNEDEVVYSVNKKDLAYLDKIDKKSDLIIYDIKSLFTKLPQYTSTLKEFLDIVERYRKDSDTNIESYIRLCGMGTVIGMINFHDVSENYSEGDDLLW